MRGRKSFGRRSFKNLSGTLERVFVVVRSVSKNMAFPVEEYACNQERWKNEVYESC